MAAADYYLCDVCGGKCFYDADLGYEFPDKEGKDSWGMPIDPHELMRGTNCKLGYCGDMAAICTTCAKTHEVIVRPLAYCE